MDIFKRMYMGQGKGRVKSTMHQYNKNVIYRTTFGKSGLGCIKAGLGSVCYSLKWKRMYASFHVVTLIGYFLKKCSIIWNSNHKKDFLSKNYSKWFVIGEYQNIKYLWWKALINSSQYGIV